MSEASMMGGDVTSETTTSTEETTTAETTTTDETTTTTDEPTGLEWMKGFEGIDPDVASDTSLKAIKDVPALIKSYVHAQRKMGGDKAVLPNKNSTPEEWLQLYQKLGLPAEFGEYEVKSPEDSLIEEEFSEGLKKVAFENNILPNQTQAIYDYINSQTKTQFENHEHTKTEELEAGISSLKEDWGEAFDKNLHKAKIAVNEFGGDELKKYLNESGLGNDPQLIRAFSKIGDSFFKEDSFEGENKPAYSLSLDEAEQRSNEIMGDLDGPYYNTMHPDHKRIVGEVNKLFQMTTK